MTAYSANKQTSVTQSGRLLTFCRDSNAHNGDDSSKTVASLRLVSPVEVTDGDTLSLPQKLMTSNVLTFFQSLMYVCMYVYENL